MIDLETRRALLKTEPNPNPGLEYLVEHDKTITVTCGKEKQKVHILLRYIPEQLVLCRYTYMDYLKQFEDSKNTLKNMESLINIILEDVTNEVIPYWMEVIAHYDDDFGQHRILMEDEQPGWHNKDLIARLSRF